ncbi:hypothetical protein PsorP6_019584 [Peronosclerospora sorghi]|nr:hypothetical protein PsorP6_019584 [Peronosclerospora sorghi]
MLDVYLSRPIQDYVSVCQVLQMLGNDLEVSKILEQLVRGGEHECLIVIKSLF